jgi:hypothetical protein
VCSAADAEWARIHTMEKIERPAVWTGPHVPHPANVLHLNSTQKVVARVFAWLQSH